MANYEIDLPDSMYDKLSLAEKQVRHTPLSILSIIIFKVLQAGGEVLIVMDEFTHSLEKKSRVKLGRTRQRRNIKVKYLQ